ncbi:MAG TPA: hypothetical protein VFV20_00345 [Candidatus Limnocylindria bacterium]|nr:hypothetical protein [Candidatus Limnocylindria bacterium]
MVLRAGAALVAGASFVGATAYVVQHPKNPAAPLQPPTAGEIVPRDAARPTATPAASGSPTPAPAQTGRVTPRASVRPPQITLQPGVRATELPGITYTHVS